MRHRREVIILHLLLLIDICFYCAIKGRTCRLTPECVSGNNKCGWTDGWMEGWIGGHGVPEYYGDFTRSRPMMRKQIDSFSLLLHGSATFFFEPRSTLSMRQIEAPMETFTSSIILPI